MMIIKRFALGPLETNAYIVGDETTGQAVVIDPGDEPDRIIDELNSDGLKVIAIVCTHAHFDHIGSVGDIKEATGAKILLHNEDLETYELAKDQAALWGYHVDDLPQPDHHLSEGDEIKIGNINLQVMHTPGHSRGSICLYGEGILITGDTIFQGSVGRTDFPGGSMEDLKNSFRRLIELPDDTKVLTGHGPETTIGREKVENFFMNEL